jgi:hypothetical protein
VLWLPPTPYPPHHEHSKHDAPSHPPINYYGKGRLWITLCLVVSIDMKWRVLGVALVIVIHVLEVFLMNSVIHNLFVHMNNDLPSPCTAEHLCPCWARSKLSIEHLCPRRTHPILCTNHGHPCYDDPTLNSEYLYACVGFVVLLLVECTLAGVGHSLWHGA